jgi:hypothetical protein
MTNPAPIYEKRAAAEGVARGCGNFEEFPGGADQREKAKTWRTIIDARYDEQENTHNNRITRYS